jgi:hypothetical protein
MQTNVKRKLWWVEAVQDVKDYCGGEALVELVVIDVASDDSGPTGGRIVESPAGQAGCHRQ